MAVKDYELLFATRLSAQCTDARVNVVTAELFSRWPTLEAIAGADLEELMEVVKPCGLYRVKATDIKKCANVLVEQYGGKVPDEMDELLKLPGVGRKTANLVLGDLFGKPAVVTDTHCIRIAGRIGLTDNTEPYKVEMDLKKIIEPEGTERHLPPVCPFWPGYLHRPFPQMLPLLFAGCVPLCPRGQTAGQKEIGPGRFLSEPVAAISPHPMHRAQLSCCVRCLFYSIRPNFISLPWLSYCFRLPVTCSASTFQTAVRSRLRAMASSKASMFPGA